MFPFFNTLTYPYLEDNDAPAYINFPYVVETSIEYGKPGLSCQECAFDEQKVGGELFNASFSYQQEGEVVRSRQRLAVNVLHVSTSIRNAWNAFVNDTQAFTGYYYENHQTK